MTSLEWLPLFFTFTSSTGERALLASCSVNNLQVARMLFDKLFDKLFDTRPMRDFSVIGKSKCITQLNTRTAIWFAETVVMTIRR